MLYPQSKYQKDCSRKSCQRFYTSHTPPRTEARGELFQGPTTQRGQHHPFTQVQDSLSFSPSLLTLLHVCNLSMKWMSFFPTEETKQSYSTETGTAKVKGQQTFPAKGQVLSSRLCGPHIQSVMTIPPVPPSSPHSPTFKDWKKHSQLVGHRNTPLAGFADHCLPTPNPGGKTLAHNCGTMELRDFN